MLNIYKVNLFGTMRFFSWQIMSVCVLCLCTRWKQEDTSVVDSRCYLQKFSSLSILQYKWSKTKSRFNSGLVPYLGWVCCWFLPCSEYMICLWVLWVSSLHNNQHSKFQFVQDRGPTWKPADVASSLNIVIYLFMYNIKHQLTCLNLQWHGVLNKHSAGTLCCVGIAIKLWY